MLKPVLTLMGAIALCTLPWSTYAAGPSAKDITVKVEKDGNAYTVSADFTIAASVDETWEVLTDFDNMAKILSNVDSSSITNREGNKFEVVQKSHVSAGLIKVSSDSVRQVELTPKTEIRSHLVKGDLKSSVFSTKIIPEGDATKVTVNGKFVAGGLSAGAITVESVEASTRRQYQELREETLRRKAHLPTPACVLAKNCPQ